MGDIEHENLPQYIAIQVSADRWQIAEKFGEDKGDGFFSPTYRLISKRMPTGDCNNRLSALQREARKKRRAGQ